jgi:ElaB/YqjD/DUF883 family membrane-anchored ribosome-binding protein
MGEAKDQVTGEGWSADQPEVLVSEASTAGATGDPDVDELIEEIASTRGEMTDTVEQIGDRLDPRRVVADAKSTVREATIGKVENMATTAGDVVGNVGQTAQETGAGILETVRRNPVPAALIGIGVTWLAMSTRQTGFRSSEAGGGGRWTSSSSTWDTTGDRDMSGASYDESRSGGAITDRVGDALGQVQGKAGDVAGQVQQTAAQVPNVARQLGDTTGRVVQENPLAIGALALGVGAAIGMALPTTRPEHEIMGQAADSLIGRAESVATEAMSQAETAARQP